MSDKKTKPVFDPAEGVEFDPNVIDAIIRLRGDPPIPPPMTDAEVWEYLVPPFED